MNKQSNKVGALIVCLALSTAVMVPRSHSSDFVTDAELASLPEYCQARLGGKNTAAYKNWNQRMGSEIFVHVHHYCFGLTFLNRAVMEIDPNKKKFILKKAIRNFDYVIKRWPKEFSLTSSAAMFRQQAEGLLNLAH